jgi:hypothetical protein
LMASIVLFALYLGLWFPCSLRVLGNSKVKNVEKSHI